MQGTALTRPMPSITHIFGIRHHGPGSARSLRAALETLEPNAILIEGPPDADDLIPLAAHAHTKPPVALLLYAPDDPQQAVFYPFALFSPEWQAITYGLQHNIPIRFMDLPVAHRFALRAKVPESPLAPAIAPEDIPPTDGPEEKAPANRPSPIAEEETGTWVDPLSALARAAGYDDAERFWDHLVEHRADSSELFAAVMEAMSALRADSPLRPDPLGIESKREAYMRKTIRATIKEGHEKIAVVCGAWHAPVLVPERMPTAAEDNKILADMPKTKVAAAWVPWTYGRLTSASGYGAGIASPGWYHHLFTDTDRETTVVRWFARIARLLRAQDLDCSSAHIIEATRLTQTLASLRGRTLPTLTEINESVLTVLTFGNTAPLALIHNKLIVSESLGTVPNEGPIAPLQLDLQRQQKRLRLPPDAEQKTIELDLRKLNDRERSQLLHRLNLLNIPWGRVPKGFTGRSKGTFKEPWQIQWQPEFAIALIEAGVLGNTLYDAATARTRQEAAKATDLPPVTALLEGVLLAELPEAIRFLMRRVENLAAVAADLKHMMAALPALANILRYGNVRKTDTTLIAHVVSSLATRITIGLPTACTSLNDEAAGEMDSLITPTHAAIQLIAAPAESGGDTALAYRSLLDDWLAALKTLASQSTLHGLLAGHATRLLLDARHSTADEAATSMSLALSAGGDPARAAFWIEGFLKGSGILLLHDAALWKVLDEWLIGLSSDAFANTLPLLRRSFALFPAPERKQMGQRVKNGTRKSAKSQFLFTDFDESRAAAALPLLGKILGLQGNPK
jgi:Family of unknown function (DUF5682)